jgi:uncharacterized membrane protein YsdA (DUF1294 family)/cold shock CspA family protein
MRHEGRISDWKDNRGFGFIAPDAGGETVFVHATAFRDRRHRPVGGERVSYELRVDASGRRQADRVAFIGAARVRSALRRRETAPLLVAAGFLAAIAVAAAIGVLPMAALVLYLLASAVAFLVYALDKSAAREDRRRTRESTLLLLGVLGGWPGALAAQALLRHKSAKTSFQLAFWLTVAVNLLAIGWLVAG